MGKGGTCILNMVRLCSECQKRWIWIWTLPQTNLVTMAKRWACCINLKGIEDKNINYDSENKPPTSKLELSCSLWKEGGLVRPGLLAILLWSIPNSEGNQVLYQPALYSAVVQKWNSVSFLNLESSQFLPTLSHTHAASPVTVDRRMGTVRIKQFIEIFNSWCFPTPCGLYEWYLTLFTLFTILTFTPIPTPAAWSDGEREVQRLARNQESESRTERK